MGTVSREDLELYRRTICAKFAAGEGEEVLFRKVVIGEWQPRVAYCHDNVDRWVVEHPSDKAVRGWLPYQPIGNCFQLTAHSVVRAAGAMFDITPFENESSRRGLRFIEDPSGGPLFTAWLKLVGKNLNCELQFHPEDLLRWGISETGSADF